MLNPTYSFHHLFDRLSYCYPNYRMFLHDVSAIFLIAIVIRANFIIQVTLAITSTANPLIHAPFTLHLSAISSPLAMMQCLTFRIGTYNYGFLCFIY